MASFQIEGTRVKGYTRVNGKQVSMPRDRTRHLDGDSPANIKAWFQHYTVTVERTHRQPARELYGCDALVRHVDEFCKYRMKREGKSAPYIRRQQLHLTKYVLPFFVDRDEPLRNPRSWPKVSITLVEYLEGKGVSPRVIEDVNDALRKFWVWMGPQGIVDKGSTIPLVTPIYDDKPTPLQFTQTPDEVLAFARGVDVPADIKFMALVGYFFSLRPQETFGLTPGHFIGGDDAKSLDACQVMALHHPKATPTKPLYGGFAVEIDQQRAKDGTLTKPKTEVSCNWVSCFNREAAVMIAELVNGKAHDELVLGSVKPDAHGRRWRKRGLQGIKLKDLRRASALWLGTRTTFDGTPLHNHLRHVDADTSALYTRRPMEDRARRGPLVVD